MNAERNCKSCYNYKNEYCNVLDMKPCYPENGCDYFSEIKKVRKKMTKEQKDKILKALVEDRNDYARECEKRITSEQGKIMGADYMLQRFLDILRAEVEPQEIESEGKNAL
jgi:hypothetical protein